MIEDRHHAKADPAMMAIVLQIVATFKRSPPQSQGDYQSRLRLLQLPMRHPGKRRVAAMVGNRCSEKIDVATPGGYSGRMTKSF